MEKEQKKQTFTMGETSKMKEKECCDEDKFVWPWIGILANVPTEVDMRTGQRIGKSLSTLRHELTLKGFNPTKVTPVWNLKGHSGFALVEFNKDFVGFEHAMKFERSYELDGHGKKAWNNGILHSRDEELYGWVARGDDYNEYDIVGKTLKKKGDLTTVSQIQKGEERKMKQLVESMSQSIKMKMICKQELEEKLDLTSYVLESLRCNYLQLNRTYQEETEKMHENVQQMYEQIQQEHDNSMLELERKREELEERARQIEQQANINEAEMEKSRLKREMNRRAMLDQNEANEEAMKLAEKHKKEKEKLHEEIKEMEAKINERQELEMEMEIKKHMMGSDGDAMVLLAKNQIELEARVLALQDIMMTLTQQERVTNDEYQDIRKELIKLWNMNEDLMSEEKVRVKIMGELNVEPFIAAVKRKHGGRRSRVENKAMELCSLWEAHIQDVQWHPFKVDISDGNPKRVVDKNDDKLLTLKNDYGEQVYNQVLKAKLEMLDHNASGSYAVLELWNFEQNRKATLEEAIEVILKIRSYLDATRNKRKRVEIYLQD